MTSSSEYKVLGAALLILCGRLTGAQGYSLVAEKKECTGSEVDKGRFGSNEIDKCANACKGVSSMFAFGTNDFGNDRCTSEGCKCICESGADEYGMCTMKDHDGYRLYRLNQESANVLGGQCGEMASNGLDDCILARIDEIYDEIKDVKDRQKRYSNVIQKKIGYMEKKLGDSIAWYGGYGKRG